MPINNQAAQLNWERITKDIRQKELKFNNKQRNVKNDGNDVQPQLRIKLPDVRFRREWPVKLDNPDPLHGGDGPAVRGGIQVQPEPDQGGDREAEDSKCFGGPQHNCLRFASSLED